MTDEQQLKLQAYLDEELPEAEAREVETWLTTDAQATALLSELTNTCNALKGFEKPGAGDLAIEAKSDVSLALGLKVPETREFYWSKIKREIQRPAPAPAAAPKASLFTWWRRAIMPLGAVAVLVIAGFVTFTQLAGGGARPIAVNSMLADAGAFTYRDESQGMTVVWLSYPAENKFAETPSGDTLSPK